MICLLNLMANWKKRNRDGGGVIRNIFGTNTLLLVYIK